MKYRRASFHLENRWPQGSVLGPQGFIAYTENLAELIEEHLLGHHMYVDDTQLMAHLTINDISSVATRLQNCMEERYHGDTCKREDPAWSWFLNGWGASVDDHECLLRLDRTCASGGQGGPPLSSQSAVDRLNHLRYQPTGCYSNQACW